jgi:hypothetical protein
MQTIVTVSYPDTAQARQSVEHYVGVLRSAFVGAIGLPDVGSAGTGKTLVG